MEYQTHSLVHAAELRPLEVLLNAAIDRLVKEKRVPVDVGYVFHGLHVKLAQLVR